MLYECERKIISEKGEPIGLVYKITENEDSAEEGMVTAYGIRVEKYLSGELVECEEVLNITARKGEIHRLFTMLSEGTVTPMCLREVVEDYLVRS